MAANNKLFALAVCSLFAAPVFAQSTYVEWVAAGRPDIAPGPAAPSVSLGGLTPFADRVSWASAAGAAVTENFNGGLTTAGSVNTCDEPVSSASNGPCFSPGQLVAGFSITSSGGGGVVVLGSGFLGGTQPSAVIGANSFAQTTDVAISQSGTRAVAIDVYSGGAAGDVTVSAFDSSDALIGAITVSAAASSPVFAGFTSPVDVARVNVAGAGDSGELLDDLAFGSGATAAIGVSTPSLSFTGVPPGTTSGVQLLTFSNSGNGAGTIDSVVFAGPFARSGGSCGMPPFSLAAGASCTLGVVFNAGAIGTVTGSLTATAGGDPIVVTLSGSAAAPPPAFIPTNSLWVLGALAALFAIFAAVAVMRRAG